MPAPAATLASTMVPSWVAIALAAPTMLVIAWHILSVQQSSMDIARRRLRIGNGLLMMFVCALLAYALGMATVPEQPRSEPAAARAFILLWSAIVGLLAVIVALAVADALITTNAGLHAYRAMRRETLGSRRAGGDSSRG